MVIAIDGPSGVGKSTVSRALADALGLPHLDTGSFYRLATLLALRAGVAPDDAEGTLSVIGEAEIELLDTSILVSGSDVTEALRSPEVTAAVSVVSALPSVRTAIVAMQREWVERRGGRAVVEGRDIGTVVFPDARLKVFLTADVATRAQRRAGDPEAAGQAIAEIEGEIRARDEMDSSREVSPLRPAEDAVTIDTSKLPVAEVVGRILDLVGSV